MPAMSEHLVRRLGRRLASVRRACLEDNLLAAYVEGWASDSEKAEVERHMAACEACHHIVAGLASEGEATFESCPALEEWMRLALHALAPQRAAGLERHARVCAPCHDACQYLSGHPEQARGLLNLIEAQRRLAVAGSVMSLAAILEAVRRRRIGLSADAERRLHRSREDHLGRTAARPGLLVWEPFGLDEDTYEVNIEVDAHEEAFPLRVHHAYGRIPEALREKLDVGPDRKYRWSVTALRAGRPLKQMAGSVWFLSPEDERVLLEKERALEDLPADQRLLARGTLYEETGLDWEACRVLRQYVNERPDDPIGHMLLARRYEGMGRLQEAQLACSKANQLME